MDELPENYQIETLEQLRALADTLRLQIVDLLVSRPMTVTQLGEALSQSPAKVHYHVRELERLGLIRLVETREKGGILEKYYRAVARDYQAAPSLLRSTPEDELVAVTSSALQALSRSVLGALRHAIRAQTQDRMDVMLAGASVWVTPDEAKALLRQIYALLTPYRAPRGLPDERNLFGHLIAYNAQFAEGEAGGGASSAEGPQGAREEEAGQSIVRRVVVAGALTYTRADLEQIVARGERLDVHVAGYCAFADDVAPELVERALARFRYKGVLSAPEPVRQLLERKQGQDG